MGIPKVGLSSKCLEADGGLSWITVISHQFPKTFWLKTINCTQEMGSSINWSPIQAVKNVQDKWQYPSFSTVKFPATNQPKMVLMLKKMTKSWWTQQPPIIGSSQSIKSFKSSKYWNLRHSHVGMVTNLIPRSHLPTGERHLADNQLLKWCFLNGPPYYNKIRERCWSCISDTFI